MDGASPLAAARIAGGLILVAICCAASQRFSVGIGIGGKSDEGCAAALVPRLRSG